MPNSMLARAEPVTKTILRIVAGLLYFMHGAQKTFGLFGGMGGNGAKAELLSLFGVAGVLEVCGGVLLIAGLFTRPAAFVLSGQMAVAYFLAHFPRGFWPLLNGGEPAVLNCFLFLYLCTAGAGPFSLDRALRKVE